MTVVSHEQWGEVSSLGSVDLWVLQSSQVRVEILTLGAIIRSVCSRGKDGQMEDVVLGYDDLEGYVSDKRYLGAVVGRVANRIAHGRFVLEGKEYQLDINNGPNALHGGLRGFNKAIWIATPVEGGVQLSLTSPDGDQGYPGEVQASVSYTLQGETLTAEYRARSTKTTPINLTNHSYFNLAGQDSTMWTKVMYPLHCGPVDLKEALFLSCFFPSVDSQLLGFVAVLLKVLSRPGIGVRTGLRRPPCPV